MLLDARRTSLGAAVIAGAFLALVIFAGWQAGDRVIAGIATAHAAKAVPEQSGYQARGVVDPETQRRRQREINDWLASERPEGAAEAPLAVEVTPRDRDQLGVPEGNTLKLRVGVVKPVNAHIRFDDLDLADLHRPQTRSHGVIQGTSDGGFVWTTVVRSEGATALRVRLSSFFLPPHAELWIYTAAGEAFGPYTWSGPDGNQDFWTHSVSGAEAFLQLRKHGPATPRDLRTVAFVVAEIAHIDTSGAGLGSSPQFASGFCSTNASCVVNGECADSSWDNVRNAVARIQFVSAIFVYICSGGLVADSDASSIPYFLTANHCVSSGREASSLEAFFQYRSALGCGETGSCSGPSVSTRTRGSSILATNKTSDYTLLRLSEPAPAGSYFLGWTTEPVASSNGTRLFRFSHPKGSPQAYSQHDVDTSRPTCTSWPRGPWIYSSDKVGAVEGGSSGSPVVNEHGQIVGQLSGACGFNVSDVCDSDKNATVDGAFANYYSAIASYVGPGSANQPPAASFTYSCTALDCSFDGSGSTDPDGTISNYAWTFGDGTSGTGQTTEHTYSNDGTYTVTLTATDNDGATGSTSQNVTVQASDDPPPGGITLSATGYKVKGVQHADLAWTGATSVEVYRDGNLIAELANSGTYTDNIGNRGPGSYTYKVCEAGTSTCSNEPTVTF